MKTGGLGREVPRGDPRGLGAALALPFASPEVDIYEGRDELLLIANLPGVSREGVTVSLQGMELTIEGKRASEGEPEGKVVALEASFSDFRRTFLMPLEIDPDGIRAEIERGVLRVHLPKAAAPKPRSIPIKAR
jgi:HSP20 family molecular chaperone IbpA